MWAPAQPTPPPPSCTLQRYMEGSSKSNKATKAKAFAPSPGAPTNLSSNPLHDGRTGPHTHPAPQVSQVRELYAKDRGSVYVFPCCRAPVCEYGGGCTQLPGAQAACPLALSNTHARMHSPPWGNARPSQRPTPLLTQLQGFGGSSMPNSPPPPPPINCAAARVWGQLHARARAPPAPPARARPPAGLMVGAHDWAHQQVRPLPLRL